MSSRVVNHKRTGKEQMFEVGCAFVNVEKAEGSVMLDVRCQWFYESDLDSLILFLTELKGELHG